MTGWTYIYVKGLEEENKQLRLRIAELEQAVEEAREFVKFAWNYGNSAFSMRAASWIAAHPKEAE
jgi:hypothetical protein